MKTLILALALAPVLAFGAVDSASARDGMVVRQVGRAAPSGLGHFTEVGRTPFAGRWQTATPHGHGRRRGHEWGGQYGYGAFEAFGGGYYGGVYEDPETLRQAGYFAGPAQSWTEGGQVHYDYDRGYPYDWYRPRDAGAAAATEAGMPSGRRISCAVEAAGIRVCRGGR